MAQKWMESCWRRSEEEGDGAVEQSGGRGNVSSLHFQAGKPTNRLHPNSGVSLWEKAERQKQTEKSKCKHHRMGGATQLWKTKMILPFWQIIKDKPYFIMSETSAPLFFLILALGAHEGALKSTATIWVSCHDFRPEWEQSWLGRPVV